MDFELAQRGRASLDFVAELKLGGQASTSRRRECRHAALRDDLSRNPQTASTTASDAN
jgi:hypothetical protein